MLIPSICESFPLYETEKTEVASNRIKIDLTFLIIYYTFSSLIIDSFQCPCVDNLFHIRLKINSISAI